MSDARDNRIEHSKTALLGWHEQLLPQAYERRSCCIIQTGDLQRLVDDLLDAAMVIEEQQRIAKAALAALGERSELMQKRD